MIKSFIITKYVGKEFLKVVLNISLVFLCMGFVLNLFEEINFFKDYDVKFGIPVLLTALFVPSLLYNMFPFVILLSGIWYFLRIKKTDEIIAMKISGLSNFSLITVPSFLSILIGIFFITSVDPITSALLTKYETIKGAYEKDKDYLAAITENGIWIKEQRLGKNNFIRSSRLENNHLIDITIYQFDIFNDFYRRIEAKSADISSLKWKIKNANIINKDGEIISENVKTLSYRSIYDVKKIKSLYSNLDTVSFWNLEKEIEILEKRGYSSKDMQAKLQQSLSFPFYLLSMVLLSGVFTLGFSFKENNWTYGFMAILASVLIFYFNRFSAALGKTDKLPIETSVWMPIFIIFIFGAVGLIHANQK